MLAANFDRLEVLSCAPKTACFITARILKSIVVQMMRSDVELASLDPHKATEIQILKCFSHSAWLDEQ